MFVGAVLVLDMLFICCCCFHDVLYVSNHVVLLANGCLLLDDICVDVVIYLDSPDQLPLSRLDVGWREFQVHFQRVQDQ